jgi:hypothetical protein
MTNQASHDLAAAGVAGDGSDQKKVPPSHRRAVRMVAITTAAITVWVLSAGSALAATNAQPGSAFCQQDDILVSTPAMTPDPQPVSNGTFTVGGSTAPQRVAWRANLTQWDGTKWVTIRYGTWYTGIAGTMYDQTGFSSTSWTTLNGAPLNYLPGFWDLPSGSYQNPIYYMVWYEYYWYADQYRNARSDSSWAASHEENRGAGQGTAFYDQTYYSYCKYPGPNWMQNVSG